MVRKIDPATRLAENYKVIEQQVAQAQELLGFPPERLQRTLYAEHPQVITFPSSTGGTWVMVIACGRTDGWAFSYRYDNVEPLVRMTPEQLAVLPSSVAPAVVYPSDLSSEFWAVPAAQDVGQKEIALITPQDRTLLAKLLLLSGGEMLAGLEKVADQLSDYAYWQMLGVLYVQDSAVAPASTWRRLLEAPREQRWMLMRPSELRALELLPEEVVVYRAAPKDRPEGFSFTLSKQVAGRFLLGPEREVRAYRVSRSSFTALFLRRNEAEVIITDWTAVRPVEEEA